MLDFNLLRDQLNLIYSSINPRTSSVIAEAIMAMEIVNEQETIRPLAMLILDLVLVDEVDEARVIQEFVYNPAFTSSACRQAIVKRYAEMFLV